MGGVGEGAEGGVWGRRAREVAAHVRSGGGFAEGEGGEGQEGDEAGDASSTSSGDTEGCRVEVEVGGGEDILPWVPRGMLTMEQARALLTIRVEQKDIGLFVRGSSGRKRRRLRAVIVENEEGGKDGVT